MLIKNLRILDPTTNKDCIGELNIEGSRVPTLPQLPDGSLDGTGYIVMPGLVDIHTHFREPGATDSETIQTGMAAAIAGGFSIVTTMPNTTPAADNEAILRFQIEEAEKYSEGLVKLYPTACCTKGRAGKEAVAPAELPSAIAFTDDGNFVAPDEAMLQVAKACKELNKVIMDHAVVPSIANGGVMRECEASIEEKIFPDAAEVEAVKRDIEVARKTGCRMHIQHLSCAEAARIIAEAQAEGVRISAEATPHHLMLAAEQIPSSTASNWKMNPPLGLKSDVQALRKAVLDGTICCFATDHAPHSTKKKEGGFAKAMFGIIGLETAAPASWTAMVTEAGMSPIEWCKAWTTRPAELLNISIPSLFEKKETTVVFLKEEEWTFEEKDIASKSHNTPFVGHKFTLKVTGLAKTC